MVVAAILAAAMSNLSAALNALSSTTIMDFYRPIAVRRGAEHPESHYLKLARGATVAWGAALLVIGYIARQWGSVLEAGLSIASVIYGSLLGVFLLGVLTRRARERSAVIGMMAGLAVMIFVKGFTTIAWTWYVVIGTSVTFLTGCLVSLFESEVDHA